MKTARITAGAMVVIAAVAIGISLADGVLAQGGGGGRGGGRGAAGPPTSTTPPAGVTPLQGRSVHDQELLSRSAVLAGQALRALQHAAADHRHVGARESSVALGRLQSRSADRQDRQPLSVQDRRRALPGADGRGEESRRPDRPHAADAARLGRLVSAPRQRGAVDLGTQPAGLHDALAADAGVSEAHGADDVPRGASATRRSGWPRSAIPKASCAGGRRRRSAGRSR